MKAQRRHELHENALVAELGRIWEFLKKWGNKIAWGALIVAVILVGRKLYVDRVNTAQSDRQAKFARYVSLLPSAQITPENRTEGLKALARQDDDPRLAALSAVALGDDFATQLVFGWDKLSDAERNTLHQQAEDYYRQVIEKFPDQYLAAAKAMYGLGKLDENYGDFDAADAQYVKVTQMSAHLNGQGVLRLAAQSHSRLEELKNQRVRFATTTSAPATGPAGPDRVEGAAATAPAGSPSKGGMAMPASPPVEAPAPSPASMAATAPAATTAP